MNPDRQQAINYLRAPANGFWRWAEEGKVLVWRDGSTVAFREEIIQIIEWLAPNGLPPFGAIIYLLAACRGKLPAVNDIVPPLNPPLPAAIGKDAELLRETAVRLRGARLQFKLQLEASLAELAKVSNLPAELNSGIRAKCVLAEAVFEPSKAERHVEARAVLNGLRESMNDAEMIESKSAAGSGHFNRQIHIVAEGLKPHTIESLLLRIKTGLDALPEEADVDLPAAERARRLIEELSRDQELGVVARAARELLAAVRLPRRLGMRDELALGGVADITNRGPLDRLLLSELAHDDLTLSVRVALNEALYLRREPPMREPPGALALLLDSGVRLWGTPRVLATAVALALIARDKQHSEIMAWRSCGKQLHPLDLLSRNGLTQHLTALEPTAHAGESLPSFAKAVSENAQNQSVLVTHRDALADPEFRRALADHPGSLGFIATVDSAGKFELHAMPLAHRPPLCEADLDLATVFDERTATPVIRTDVDVNLPAIFKISPFPFLMPLSGSVNFWVAGTDGLNYAVLEDRRLVQYESPESGGRVLANELPGGKTTWMDCDGSTVHVVKTGSNQRPARLLSLDLPHGQLRVVDLVVGPELLAVHRYGDAIVLIRHHDVRAYSLADGRLLGQAPNPHRWLNGRFFRGTNHFYFVVWDGERVKFEQVTMPSTYLTSSVSAVFDRDGLAGPWILYKNWDVVSTESGQVIKLKHLENHTNFALHAISRHGHRLFVPVDHLHKSQGGMLYKLNEGPAFEYCKTPEFALNPHPPLPARNIFRFFESMVILPDAIALCGRKNRWLALGLDEHGKLRISKLPIPANVSAKKEFPEQRRKTAHGCTLRVAELTNGSKVFLDSRGLLHFKSSNPDVPEVSVVLADGEVAGWASDGCVCGPPFFFEFIEGDNFPKQFHANPASTNRPDAATISPSPVGTGEGRGEGARASRPSHPAHAQYSSQPAAIFKRILEIVSKP
jgi:hypothetical protein